MLSERRVSFTNVCSNSVAGDVAGVHKYFEKMTNEGIKADKIVYNALIMSHAKQGLLEKMVGYFKVINQIKNFFNVVGNERNRN